MTAQRSFLKKLLRFSGWFFLYSSIFVLSTLITMYFLIKGESVKVPDIRGKKIDEAIVILKRSGVGIKIKDERYTFKYDKGQIVEQVPQPGSSIKKGHTVFVVVSKGKDVVKIPDIVGKDFKTLDIELLEYHLVVGRRAAIHSGTPKGVVIAQFPPAGVQVPAESEINVLISNGERKKAYIMPDFIGKNIQDVMPRIKGAGLSIGPVREIPYETLPKGIIVRQFPQAGHKVVEGNIITFEVSK